MSSENYRCYCLDGAGHLHEPEWFHADSDEEAIAQISAERPDALCEIWQGRRLVAKLSPSIAPSVNISAGARQAPRPAQLQSA